ncbi:MAG: putative abductin-like protein [Myxococcaceae bacterium]|nr:putative abductin-like protein [Myxococcaceae bacterium]
MQHPNDAPQVEAGVAAPQTQLSQLRDGCLASQLEVEQEASDLDSMAAQPTESLPQASIQRVIDAHAREVRGCYQSALVSTRSLSGSVGVHFVIGLDGSVPLAEVTSGTPELRELGCCITRYIRSWTFDVPGDHGVVHVQYPYTLDSVATQSELWTSVATPADATPQVGALRVRELASVIDAHNADLQRCYERTASGAAPRLRVLIRLRIAAEGAVRQVSVGPEASAALRACIRSRAQTWRFPRARVDSEFGFDMRFSQL